MPRVAARQMSLMWHCTLGCFAADPWWLCADGAHLPKNPTQGKLPVLAIKPQQNKKNLKKLKRSIGAGQDRSGLLVACITHKLLNMSVHPPLQ